MVLNPITSRSGEYMRTEDEGSRFGASDYLLIQNFFIGKGKNNTGLFFFPDITETRKDSNHDWIWSQVTVASNLLGLSGLCTCGYLALATWHSPGGT